MQLKQDDTVEQFDVVIVGAGLSGIGSACHLKQKCPSKNFVILEGRQAIGGTWDLFRYPGIRSDSDMHTLGYVFKPWNDAKAIADGPSILRYVNETADENGIREHIRFGHRVEQAHWSSDDATWTVEAEHEGERVQIACNMLLLCGGYYDYDRPHRPNWDGEDDFKGTIVHPQFWPEDLDYQNRNVAVIGSGATAMTLVPALTMGGAKHVVMVQRSPTYVLSLPSRDKIANFLRRILPDRWAYAITRWKNVKRVDHFYRLSRKNPGRVKGLLLKMVREALGPNFDIKTHFTPRYNPWDQRICLIPDNDLFDAINDGKASVRTETIDRFTEDGLKLVGGEVLRADIIVVATGLRLQILNGVSLRVDGKTVNPPDHWSYQGLMLSDVPNLVLTFGYVNASWTLRSDLTAEYACRLINELDRTGNRQATPRLSQEERTAMQARPWIDIFSSGYIRRNMHFFPKQGDRIPWRNTQDYLADRKIAKRTPIEDGVLELSHPPEPSSGEPMRARLHRPTAPPAHAADGRSAAQ